LSLPGCYNFHPKQFKESAAVDLMFLLSDIHRFSSLSSWNAFSI